MSAYMVSNEHIRVMVHAARQAGMSCVWLGGERIQPQSPEGGRLLGQKLVDANAASIEARYGDTDAGYTYRHAAPRYTTWHPLELCHAIRGYMYQAREVEDWYTSDTLMFCQHLISGLEDMTAELAGLDELPWTISDDDQPFLMKQTESRTAPGVLI